MTKEERYISILQFRCKVLQSSGNSYEELFTCVMQQANPNFIQVKPQGRWGDKKNDGFDPTTGTFYQIYAPEDLSSTEDNAINKLNEDFTGLKAFWPQVGYNVQHFFYALNDRFKGVPPAVLKNVKAMDNNNPDIEVNVLKDYDQYLRNLYGDYMKLPPADKQVGHHYNKGLSLTEGYQEYMKKHRI